MSERELSTGDMIRQIDQYLRSPRVRVAASRNTTSGAVEPHVLVRLADLRNWRDGVVFAAAQLDPDNPPLTPEQLARMKPRARP